MEFTRADPEWIQSDPRNSCGCLCEKAGADVIDLPLDSQGFPGITPNSCRCFKNDQCLNLKFAPAPNQLETASNGVFSLGVDKTVDADCPKRDL